MNVEGISGIALVLADISTLSLSETALSDAETCCAISARFWKSRAEEALRQLQRQRREGADLMTAVEQVLADTAANLTLIISTGQDLIVATGWCGHGLYWCREPSGRLVIGDAECLLAARCGRRALQPASVMRYLHDDANISPLSSLFEGIGRIPGGCRARFTAQGGEAALEAMPLRGEPTATPPLQRQFSDALDSTAREIVEQADGGLIYAQVSGGLDGLVILASLIRQGGRVLAIYGDDGEEQHAINELVVEALRRRFPRAQLDYRWIRRGTIAEQLLERQQEARCSRLIKGNYLKRNYKLALADAGAAQSPELPVCAVNGYGIDELYSGAKGDASLSTIHPLNATLAIARLISGWRTSRPGLRWLLWQLGRGSRNDAAGMRRRARLSRHLIGAGKAGGSLGLCAAREVRERFEAVLRRDGEALSGLLSPLLPGRPTLTQLTCCCKRFIYGLVEQNHLIRFAAHGQAAGLPYILPFEAGRIRRILEGHSPSLAEIRAPKQALLAYLQQLEIDYGAITGAVTRDGSSRRKQLKVTTGRLRAWLKRAVAPLIRSEARNDKGGSNPSLDRALRQVGRHHPAQRPEMEELLGELRQISGNSYIDALENAIQTGEAARGSFSTKQIYNYAHLVRYVLATRERRSAC
jgi:hypothetical protein